MSAPPKVRKALPQLAQHPLKIVVYLRRQDQYAEAFYKQRIKNGRISVPFTEFLDGRVGRRITDYVGLLSAWANTFPNATIVPRISDRWAFPDGAIVADFASLLGVNRDQLTSSEPERSISPSRDVIDILLALAPQLEKGELRTVFHMDKAENLEGFTGSRDLFTRSRARHLLPRVHCAQRRIAESLFP